MGKKERSWGFLVEKATKNIWVHFEEYLNTPKYKRHHASKVAQAKKEK
jgi:hypothetical protein